MADGFTPRGATGGGPVRRVLFLGSPFFGYHEHINAAFQDLGYTVDYYNDRPGEPLRSPPTAPICSTSSVTRKTRGSAFSTICPVGLRTPLALGAISGSMNRSISPSPEPIPSSMCFWSSPTSPSSLRDNFTVALLPPPDPATRGI